jgi:hypothetical protein
MDAGMNDPYPYFHQALKKVMHLSGEANPIS